MNYYEKYNNYKDIETYTEFLEERQPEGISVSDTNEIPKYYMGWKIKSKKNIKKNKLVNNIFDYKKIPTEYNLHKKYSYYFPEIIDQQDINCCVPICVSIIYHYLTFKQNNIIKMKVSSLYLYHLVKQQNIINSNDSNDSNNSDNNSGITILETLKVLKKIGSCPEFLYSYNKPNFNNIPDEKLINYANKCKLINFTKITRFDIKKYLLNNNPIICGIKVFNSFHSTKTIQTGIIDLPKKLDYLLGGHSIVIIGYSDYINSYIFINSWGSSWGNNGFGVIPYSYINNKNYSDEFYILNKITDPDILLINNINNNNNNNNIIISILLLLLTLLLKIKIIFKP